MKYLKTYESFEEFYFQYICENKITNFFKSLYNSVHDEIPSNIRKKVIKDIENLPDVEKIVRLEKVHKYMVKSIVVDYALVIAIFFGTINKDYMRTWNINSIIGSICFLILCIIGKTTISNDKKIIMMIRDIKDKIKKDFSI